jgi:alpha-L-fucosidase
MGNAWGWVPGDRYKSSRELVHLLVKIVAKGGNLLLGVGPNGKGEFEPAVYERFEAMGRWLKANGEAIYGTRPVEPYQEGRTAYTAKGDKTVYAIYLSGPDETLLPASLDVRTDLKGQVRVTELSTSRVLSHKVTGEVVRIAVPKTLRTALAASEAVVFKITAIP